jgi:hypothetical protein
MKKYLVFVILGYLLLFLQSVRFINDEYHYTFSVCLDNSSIFYYYLYGTSNLIRGGVLFIWLFTLIIHLIFYFFGLSMVVGYSHSIIETKSNSLTPIIESTCLKLINKFSKNEAKTLNISLQEFGTIAFNTNNFLILVLHKVTQYDTLFICIWDIFFISCLFIRLYFSQKDYSKFYDIFGYYSIWLLATLFVQFQYLLPLGCLLFLVFIISFILVISKVQNIDLSLPSFKETVTTEYYYLTLCCLLFFNIIRMILYSNIRFFSMEIFLVFVYCLIHSYFLATIFHIPEVTKKTLMQNFINSYGTNFFQTYLGKYLSNLWSKSRELYYQFFFLYCLYKVIDSILYLVS